MGDRPMGRRRRRWWTTFGIPSDTVGYRSTRARRDARDRDVRRYPSSSRHPSRVSPSRRRPSTGPHDDGRTRRETSETRATDDDRTNAVIEGLKYMPSHEWAKVEGDVATVGITDHAQVRPRRRDAVGACAQPKPRRRGEESERARARARERERGGVNERTNERAMIRVISSSTA